MGLDMYAYAASEPEQYSSSRELAYWRKHPNLHGWMHKLWEEKGHSGTFNGDELELTWEDLDRLEHVVQRRKLPGTSGFFFGNNADEHYKDSDLAFVKAARAEIFSGLRVFYNSSW